mmetsp:Transcript_43263/g.78744  ORF Transcript_43263/g.78744 Transcript_43263/m.78744 type:complete len:388 (-) Transcript_43263:206-1369(-)
MPSEEGRWRLLNPLSIRFSQPRINPHFRDGHLLNETAEGVYEVPLEDALRAAQHASANRDDAAAGAPPYDTVLVPPFPAIRVISWLPKIRTPDGEAAKDERGEQLLGKRAWFALDNRRLHALQVAAVNRWPTRCCVVVRCIEEVPASTVKELRKFRTTTEGRSVEVGVHVGETDTWTWAQALPSSYGLTRPFDLEAEGLFAEDLWDAAQWAPDAHAIALRFPAEEDSVGKSAAKQHHTSKDAASNNNHNKLEYYLGHNDQRWAHEQKIGATAPHYLSQQFASGGVAEHACMDEIFAALARGAGLRPPPRRSGKSLEPCPDGGWQYIDPSGIIQGPFHLDRMKAWYARGFFYPDLPMRCSSQDEFLRFQDLFPPGSEPFNGHVVRQAM